jgi:hypothetical protein
MPVPKNFGCGMLDASGGTAVMFFRGGLTSVDTGEYVVPQAYKR